LSNSPSDDESGGMTPISPIKESLLHPPLSPPKKVSNSKNGKQALYNSSK